MHSVSSFHPQICRTPFAKPMTKKPEERKRNSIAEQRATRMFEHEDFGGYRQCGETQCELSSRRFCAQDNAPGERGEQFSLVHNIVVHGNHNRAV